MSSKIYAFYPYCYSMASIEEIHILLYFCYLVVTLCLFYLPLLPTQEQHLIFWGRGVYTFFGGGEGIHFPTEADFFHTNKKSVCLFFDTKYQYNHFRFGGLWCLTILSTIFQLYRAWLSVLLMQKTKVPEENHRPVASR